MADGPRKTNWFAIWVSVARGRGARARRRRSWSWLNNQRDRTRADGRPRRRRTSTPRPARSSSATARTRLDTYIDFMCPVCNQFEQVYGEAIHGLVDDGTITLDIHPISILDRAVAGHRVLHARGERDVLRRGGRRRRVACRSCRRCSRTSPPEGTTGLTDEQILEIAAARRRHRHRRVRQRRRVRGYVTAMTRETPVAAGRRRHRHADDRDQRRGHRELDAARPAACTVVAPAVSSSRGRWTAIAATTIHDAANAKPSTSIRRSRVMRGFPSSSADVRTFDGFGSSIFSGKPCARPPKRNRFPASQLCLLPTQSAATRPCLQNQRQV